ncbi:MAG: hypothetical protein Ct9H300mP19_01940 [Dehalococcoidia bacterium]|nr:MAG: hypothetical protein Ct9H300mP19_01940 [Dehalococcoidia bacterium]
MQRDQRDAADVRGGTRTTRKPGRLKRIQEQVPFPLATGERLLSRWEFREVIEKQAVSLLQPDVAHCGGPSELKRIANYAESITNTSCRIVRLARWHLLRAC